MAWTYLVASEESASHSENGCDQSPIAKSIPIVKESCCQRWYLENSQVLQFGTMLKPLNQHLCPWLTLYTVDSHARISALQDLEKVWQESEADCFSRSSGYVAKLSLDSSFWKMCQPSQLEEEPKWLDKLPRWGMIVDGALYRLRPLEHYTSEIAGSCWPTPAARDWKDSGREPSAQTRKSPCLPAAVMMATPTASQSQKPIRKPSPSRISGNHGDDLQDSIGRLNPESIGKRLCPRWVSVLMGYPTTWTDCEPWAIQWYLSKRKKRSKS